MNVIVLPASAFDGERASICDERQILHIKNVLGAGLGDTLKIAKLGDKLGTASIARLDDVCVLENVQLTTPPPPKLPLTVILALPRPKVLRRLIMDMTAFGVANIILINSVRTDKSYWGSPLLDRLCEFIQEGLEQGVDCVPPTITLAKRFKPFVQDKLPAIIANKTAVVAHPYGEVGFGVYQSKHGLPHVMIVGAEGGFVPYEIELLQSVGVDVVTLGERILRTESAVSALVGRWLL